MFVTMRAEAADGPGKPEGNSSAAYPSAICPAPLLECAIRHIAATPALRGKMGGETSSLQIVASYC